MTTVIGTLVFFLVVLLASAVKILKEWERGVILRFGRSIGVRGPGIIILIPLVEQMIRVNTQIITMDVQPQDIITSDNVSMKVNAVVYFRVTSPEEAITKVEDYYFATSQLAQTTLRSVLGQFQMDDILQQRDRINVKLQEMLDSATEPWGIKVSLTELKYIELSTEMQRAMARQAEAERERRAKVISAEGEMQRAHKLSEASDILSKSPAAIQLAYLQALTEVASDNNTNTIVFPLPIEILKAFGHSPDLAKVLNQNTSESPNASV